MLDRQHGVILFECESCDEVLDTETSNFDDARATMQREGWKARKVGQDWFHYCPDCTPPSTRGPLL